MWVLNLHPAAAPEFAAAGAIGGTGVGTVTCGLGLPCAMSSIPSDTGTARLFPRGILKLNCRSRVGYTYKGQAVRFSAGGCSARLRGGADGCGRTVKCRCGHRAHDGCTPTAALGYYRKLVLQLNFAALSLPRFFGKGAAAKQQQAGASSSKQEQAAASRSKQQQAAASSSKQQQAASSSSKQQQAAASSSKQ